jgi:hypothetical protein
MALYFKEPEKPFWMTSLEGLLGSLGNAGATIGASYIQSSREKEANSRRKEALVNSGYPEEMADQIARGGDQATAQAMQQAQQKMQAQQQQQQYADAMRMGRGQVPLYSQQQQITQSPSPLPQLQGLGPQQGPGEPQSQMQQSIEQPQEMTDYDRIEAAVAYGVLTPEQGFKAIQDLKKEESKADQAASRETSKWRESQLQKKEAIEQNLDRLKILKKISKSGELDNSTWTSGLKAIGLGDVKALQGAKAQEYNKVIADFISSANAMFPGKVTDAKLRMFMQRLPTADLDPEARKEIMKDLEYFMKSELAGPTAMLELMKENKGKPFPGIMEATAERAAQIRDRYESYISFLDENSEDQQGIQSQIAPSERVSGGMMETLKDIPRVAAQGVKGAVQVPVRAAEFATSFGKKPELPKDYYKGRGLTPEQEARSEAVMKLGARPKTSESIEHITPKPKTAVGKQAGEYAETLGSLLVPLPGMQGVALGKAAKLAGVGQIAKWASQKVGASEKTSDGFKLGSMLLYSLGSRGGPIKEASKIYEEGMKHMPSSVKVSSEPLKKMIKDIEESFSPEIMANAKSKKVLTNVLNSFEDLISTPKVAAKDILEFKKLIPEAVQEASKYGGKAAVPLYDLSKKLSSYLKSSAEIPEQARKALKIGDELYTGYNNIMKTSKTIKDAALKLKGLSLGTLGILGLGTKATTGIVGTIGAAKTGYAFAKEMLTNPSIRHHFAKTAQLAARESTGPLLKELTMLDNAVKKQEKRVKY